MMTRFYSKSAEVSHKLWIVQRANPKQTYTENKVLVRTLIPGQLYLFFFLTHKFQGGGAKTPSTPH